MLFYGTLYCGCVCTSCGRRAKKRGLVKRVFAFYGRKPTVGSNASMNLASVGNCPAGGTQLSYCRTTLCRVRVRVRVRVSCPTCLGSKVRRRQLVVLNAYGSVTSVYALLNVGSKRDKVRPGLYGNVRKKKAQRKNSKVANCNFNTKCS
jgi:hypothetical protein